MEIEQNRKLNGLMMVCEVNMENVIYATGLKAPATMPEGLVYDSIQFKCAYKMMYDQAKKFKPETGVKESRIKLPGYCGDVIGCFVLEPEKCVQVPPTMIYYHGGGFCAEVGEINLKLAEYYVRHLGCKVFIPEYRTTFEEKYPFQIEDCYEATKYISFHHKELGTSKQIVLYGDSAGGCLAAAVTLMARDRKEFSICAQMLIYPCVDFKMTGKTFETYKAGGVTADFVKFVWNFYLGSQTPEILAYASPIYAEDFSELPIAYIEPHEHDCLRDDGIAYARKLEEAGVQVICNEIAGSYHGVEEQFETPFVQELLLKRVKILKSFFTGRWYD